MPGSSLATVMQAAKDATASITASIVENEAQLVAFSEGEGLRVYTADVDAFRTRAQKMYLESDFSKDWPAGLLERVNFVQ